MIQMILLKLFIIFHTSYGTSDDLKNDLDKAWAEFDKQLKCDNLQYIGYNEGMEDNMDMHSKIKRQYLSSMNNIRNWHGVEPLKQNNDLDVFAQSFANNCTRLEQLDPFHSIFGIFISSRSFLNFTELGKKVPYEIYRAVDDDDKPFDFEANEDEMIKIEKYSWKCRLSTTIIWKSSINIGIGVAKKSETINNRGKVDGNFYVIVAIIHPNSHVLGKYKEKITPRNLEIMKHDGYFEFLQEAKKRDENMIKYDFLSYVKKLTGSSSKRNVSLEKKEN
ncbi:uncharacterized protein LOC126902327 isoform X7 [Daktulosphaira vitifoliae]|uniref:uncharacterized protein LOC126902327 isoform X5 n=1 Tax=Daktulosphaira vitifoliae TaxID=58002 RepID=UPI0021AAE69F|nr:uncharacterized protein LOC126902327 isoform X5 [Daktulosphaira vitifoliae]XP_050535426.1 uncharacterized protein LOC126902327 isoform X7 [Daktulosphaira vitifoliae]